MPLKLDDLKTVESYRKAIKIDLGRLNSRRTRFWVYKDIELASAGGGKQKLPALISLVDDVAVKAVLKDKHPLCLGTCSLERGKLSFTATSGTVPVAAMARSIPQWMGKTVLVEVGDHAARGEAHDATTSSSGATPSHSQSSSATQAPPQHPEHTSAPPSAPHTPGGAAAVQHSAPGGPSGPVSHAPTPPEPGHASGSSAPHETLAGSSTSVPPTPPPHAPGSASTPGGPRLPEQSGHPTATPTPHSVAGGSASQTHGSQEPGSPAPSRTPPPPPTPPQQQTQRQGDNAPTPPKMRGGSARTEPRQQPEPKDEGPKAYFRGDSTRWPSEFKPKDWAEHFQPLMEAHGSAVKATLTTTTLIKDVVAHLQAILPDVEAGKQRYSGPMPENPKHAEFQRQLFIFYNQAVNRAKAYLQQAEAYEQEVRAINRKKPRLPEPTVQMALDRDGRSYADIRGPFRDWRNLWGTGNTPPLHL